MEGLLWAIMRPWEMSPEEKAQELARLKRILAGEPPLRETLPPKEQAFLEHLELLIGGQINTLLNLHHFPTF